MANTKGLSKTEEKKPKRTRPDRTVQLEPGDNSRYIQHSMAMWNWVTPDMHNNTEVSNRVADYFRLCDQYEVKPSVAGLALAFSVERNTLWRWVNDIQGDLAPECRNTLKKAYQILNAQMESYMQEGRINPVSGIFLMKNNMGYQDKQEMVLTPNQNMENITPEQLQQKYLTDSASDFDADPSDS